MPTLPVILSLNRSNYPEIMDLWESSVRATHHFLRPEEIRFYRPLVQKYGLPQSNLFGIRRNQKLSAFIGLQNTKIEMLFVRPDSFRQGLGSALLSFAIKEHGCRFIDVNEENPEALAVYRKFGFLLVKRDATDDCGKPHPILHLALPA